MRGGETTRSLPASRERQRPEGASSVLAPTHQTRKTRGNTGPVRGTGALVRVRVTQPTVNRPRKRPGQETCSRRRLASPDSLPCRFVALFFLFWDQRPPFPDYKGT